MNRCQFSLCLRPCDSRLQSPDCIYPDDPIEHRGDFVRHCEIDAIITTPGGEYLRRLEARRQNTNDLSQAISHLDIPAKQSGILAKIFVPRRIAYNHGVTCTRCRVVLRKKYPPLFAINRERRKEPLGHR